MEKEVITVEYKGHKIVADILPVGSKPQVFYLHGAGGAQRKLGDPIRKILLDNNISSSALDFIGYGETGGDLKDSSLHSRTEQVEVVIKKIEPNMPLALIGSSMGGYNAIKLTEIYDVKLLVLIAPGVFDTTLYDVPFGENFSAIIRKERSWDNTDAWQILKNYKGKLLLVFGDQDNVIPAEIFDKIYDNSINALHREKIIIPGAPHKLMTDYFPAHPEIVQKLGERIIELIK